MKKAKEVSLEIPKTEIRCFFCYCSLKNETVYVLDDSKHYHYECILEKFRANEVSEFQIVRINGIIDTIQVPPETKRQF